ncbi:MAG: VWA domain-containing protein [Alphaproteobacteria bacterium]|nr:VWA domain-containing protein [Alphaproteobacteria bacterium]
MKRPNLSALSAAAAVALTGMSANADPAPSRTGHVHSYILLDRTGSMQSIWEETLSSVNAYAGGLAKTTPDQSVQADITLAVFDAQEGLQFDVIRKATPAGEWRKVTDEDATPRGMTPLYDAIGRLVALAEEDAPERAVVVIMTDGEENASQEVTREGARSALDRIRARGWEVVFLGADFTNFGDAVGVGQTTSRNMGVKKGQMKETMERLSEKSRAWAAGEAPSVEWTPEDRAIAGEAEAGQDKSAPRTSPQTGRRAPTGSNP